MTQILERLLDSGPIVGPLAILVLVGAAREWWVWGYVFRKEIREKEFWRDRALENLGLAEKSLDVAAETVVEDLQ